MTTTQKTQKTKPWYLKPYDPKDPLDIPMFLRRALETPEQAASRKAFANELVREEREIAQARQRKRDAEYAAMRAEELQRNKAKAANHQRREEQKTKKAAKQDASVKVLTAIEAGHSTVQQLQKATGLEPTKLVKQGLKILLKAGKVVKVDGSRKYQSAWKGTAAPPPVIPKLDRPRLPKNRKHAT